MRLLRSNIAYRSRCYWRQRDLEAAREDVERARARAARRQRRRWPASTSRPRSSPSAWATGCPASYAEGAKRFYEALNDQPVAAANNLGGLNLVFGKPDEAIEYLKSPYSTALDADKEAAQARLARRSPPGAERLRAGRALRTSGAGVLEGRVDFLHEIGRRSSSSAARPGAGPTGRGRGGVRSRRFQL